MSLPLLAMAAANIASCSGDTSSLNCPIADIAVYDLSLSGTAGNEPGVTGNGMFSVLFTPNCSAMFLSTGAVSRMPSLAKAVLQDSRKASLMGGLPLAQGSSPSLCSKLPFGRVRTVGAGMVVLGLATRPLVNAAEPVTILKDEPGGKFGVTARFSSGWDGSVSSLLSTLLSSVPLKLVSSLGLNVG